MADSVAMPRAGLPMSTISAADDGILRVIPTLTTTELDGAVAYDPCAGTYTCPCLRCMLEREQRVRNGVRPDHANPFRRLGRAAR